MLGVSIAPIHLQAASELEQHLRDQYQGKTLLLRDFYSGDRLRYDSTGSPASGASPGDWTTSGFVQVNDIRVSDRRLTVKAKRLVVELRKGPFQFADDTPKKRKKGPFLEIEVDLESSSPPPEQVDAALSKVFLTAQDSFAELVPDYWKPCVPQGLSGGQSNCIFSPDFADIPGIASQRQSTAPPSKAGSARYTRAANVTQLQRGMSPPRAIFSPEPQFSEVARQAKFQGVITLGLVVDTSGNPIDIHILTPLGCGLDEKAVQAVQSWRFKPAEKDGQPINFQIAVEVDFHLY